MTYLIRSQVYSPHTALDAAPKGLGDWLADIVTGTPASVTDNTANPEDSSADKETPTPTLDGDDPFVAPKRPVYLLQHHPSTASIRDGDLKLYVPFPPSTSFHRLSDLSVLLSNILETPSILSTLKPILVQEWAVSYASKSRNH